MSIISAVFVKHGAAWRACSLDPTQSRDLDDLADDLRSQAPDGGTALAVFENEDEWFALARVDGDDDPRVFLSDDAAVRSSPLATVLTDEEGDDPLYTTEDDPGDEESDEDDLGSGDTSDPAEESAEDAAHDEDDTARDLGADDEDDADDASAADGDAAWGGDVDLLDDQGVSAADLAALVAEFPDDPGSALDEIGDRAGFADLLETLG